ncbi:MAG TPA: prolyl oligopeptidase family serine peptidase [Mycobacteriales bacterium]|nr:prolyl oligopeptidase family serine peptidase [Mycobacteriales bacterium]
MSRAPSSRRAAALLAAGGLLTAGAVAAAADPELPVLHAEQRRGVPVVTPLAPERPVAKTVDGDTADWVGEAPGLSGFTAYSRGELVHTDYLFDAFGADDGDDAERVARNDALAEVHPGFYRLEPTYQYDIGGELGAPTGELGVEGERQYGDAQDVDGRGHVAAADLRELRVAASRDDLLVLASTTTMTGEQAGAVLLLADTAPGEAEHDVPFGSGLTTRTAEVAMLIAPTGGTAVDLRTGERTAFPVAADPTGHANVLEAAVPLRLLAGRGLRLSAATGLSDGDDGLADLRSDRADVVNVANVAFRPEEPVRIRFDRQQAFALAAGTIDGFAVDVDVAGLRSGRTEALRAGPGYHERHLLSTEDISREGDLDGVWQPYGVYVPTSYDPAGAARLTWWMHWRGGDTHDGAVVSPRIMRDFGEDVDGLVVAPRGRGTSTWYLGRGHADFLQVWDDVMAEFAVDRNRVYVTGHSMGGWASYLLSILYPDRFAAALPYAGVPTQGLWAGCELDPCWQGTNGGNAKTQWTTPLLENLRNVPIGISHGALDELVPVTGVTRQAEQLTRLGYQHRYYVFPTYEHYSHPIHDEWAEGARYSQLHTRDPDPARVTYRRSMPFERTVETGPDQGKPYAGLSFDFDSAYWMSGLTPADAVHGVATVDATSLAIPAAPRLLVPEAGGPASEGQLGPWTMTGLRSVTDPAATTPAAVNGFRATLTGATAVQLDLQRMRIATDRPITATVTTQAPLTLRLAGSWPRPPRVTAGGEPVDAEVVGGVLEVRLPAGTSALVVA